MPTPTPHPPRANDAARRLEVRILWGGDATLRVEHLPPGRGFRVGTSGAVDFGLEGDPDEPWQLVVADAGGPRVRIPEGARFHILRSGEAPPLVGACDRTFDHPLGEGDSVRITHRGLEFQVATSELPALARPRGRVTAGLAMTVLAAGVVACASYALRAPERPRIVAETTVDLSNPVVAALVARRRAEPTPPRTEPRTVAPSTPAPASPPGRSSSPTGGATPSVETPPPRPAGPGAAVTTTGEAGPRASGSTRATPPAPAGPSSNEPASNEPASNEPASNERAQLDFESDVVASDAPPSQLGAIRSHVRALSRCFDERVVAERDRTPAARAALEECLARAPTVRPDAIVSYDIEVRDSRGNVERAGGGRFGIAVTP